MRVLRKFRDRWRRFWGSNLDWTAQVDSHRWENKIEILRRLAS